MDATNFATLVAAMNMVGKLLKDTPMISDDLIPKILAISGALIAMGLCGFELPVAIEGAGAGLAAVGGNQLWKKHMNGKNNNGNTTTTNTGGPVAGTPAGSTATT